MINNKIKILIIFSSFLISFLIIFYTYKIIVPEKVIVVLEQETKELKKKISYPEEKKKPEIYEIVNSEDMKKSDNLKLKDEEVNAHSTSLKDKKQKKEIFDTKEIYRVQFASLKDPEKIQKLYDNIKTKFPKYFKNNFPFVEQKKIQNKGTFYRVQSFEYYSKNEADIICGLFNLEKLNCIIVKGIDE